MPTTPEISTINLGWISLLLTNYDPMKFEKIDVNTIVGNSVCVYELVASGKYELI